MDIYQRTFNDFLETFKKDTKEYNTNLESSNFKEDKDFFYFLGLFLQVNCDLTDIQQITNAFITEEIFSFGIFRKNNTTAKIFKDYKDRSCIQISYSDPTEYPEKMNESYFNSQNFMHLKNNISSIFDKEQIIKEGYHYSQSGEFKDFKITSKPFYKHKHSILLLYDVNFSKLISLIVFTYYFVVIKKMNMNYLVFEELYSINPSMINKSLTWFGANIDDSLFNEFKMIEEFLELDYNGLLTDESKDLLELNFKY